MKKTITTIALILSMSLTTPAHAQVTEVGRLYATIDIGQYIEINNTGPIKVYQDESSADPYHTFKGCRDTVVECNFNLAIRASATATSPAQGQWSVQINPEVISMGTTDVSICITGLQVQTQYLEGGQSDVPVAEIVIEVMPI